MSTPTNIFGLTRQRITIAGLLFLSCYSLLPHERIWLQENANKARDEYNKAYLDFIGKIQKELGLQTEDEAYHLVRSYYRGNLEDLKLLDRTDLAIRKNPFPQQPDTDTQELTYFIDSRLIKSEFPKAEFKEAFGLDFKDKWTVEHTKAIAEILPQIEEFYAKETNGGKAPDPAVDGEGKTD